jgi:hypothetical protein
MLSGTTLKSGFALLFTQNLAELVTTAGNPLETARYAFFLKM